MKTLLTFLTLTCLFFLPASGQKQVTMNDLEDVMILVSQGQPEKAREKIDELRKTVTVKDSLYTFLVMQSAEMNMQAFACEEVVKDLEEAILLEPRYEIECQSRLAEFKKYMGDFPGAIAAYKRIFQLDPQHEITFNNMASTYNRMGKYHEALGVLNTNPHAERLPTEHYHYAFAYYHLNKLDSAKLHIRTYLLTTNAVDDHSAYALAARIYAGLNDSKTSCEHITQAVSILDRVNPEKELSELSEKIQNYYFVKEARKEMAETRKLRPELCK